MKTSYLYGTGVLAVAMGVAALTASRASADGCQAGSCGRVTNNTPWNMYVTTTLGSGPDYCDVWNWEGGQFPSWKHASCTQVLLRPGETMGGDGVDVDAYTFNDREYKEQFGRFATTKRGVWTKIRTFEWARCFKVEGDSAPRCGY
jgi:hypothetical protein